MFCGYLSIIYTSNEQYIYAGWLIIAASIFDALDGAVARLTKSSSELGVELDSLSDIISFGAAPAFLLYATWFFQFDVAGVLISSLVLIAAGFRLARFNVQLVGFSKSFFFGLPTPSSAITIAAFILSYHIPNAGFQSPYNIIIWVLALLLPLLMISKIKYETMPGFSLKSIKQKPFHFLFIAAAIVLLITSTAQGLFFIFVFMILFGIFRYFFVLIFK
ncbi:MAG: CDP-diacylglycerol--serine O-phosphatidyltransferase [Ignavibacteriaceae bacterium]